MRARPPHPTGTHTLARQRPPVGARAGSRPPIIYFDIGWMKSYAGPITDDKTFGGHGYLDDHSNGAKWRTADGRELLINERITAVLACS
jgi:hypothetical protein